MNRGWHSVVCVASGPSFTVEQANLIADALEQKRCHAVVVNDNWRRVPTADVLYAADLKWWSTYIDAVRAGFHGELWTQDRPASVKFGLHCITPLRGNGLLPRTDHRITLGSNSGFQAIMLARLFGARRILLVGYDMMRAADGRKHWFGDHPKLLGDGEPRTFIRHFDAIASPLLAEGTDVVNCTISSALTSFRRADLAETLAEATN